MVSETSVQVGYGICPSPLNPSPGVRAYWISSEYVRHTNGTVIYPKMYKSSGNLDAQAEPFIHQDVPAMEFVDVKAAFAADPAIHVVPPLQPDPANPGVAAPIVSVWRALPIHPRLALLFMQGMSIRAAVSLVSRLVTVIPPEHRAQADPLVDWIRAAATSNGAAPELSEIHQANTRFDHLASQAAEDWYYSVTDRWALRGAAGPLAEPPAPGDAGNAQPGPIDARIVTILEGLQDRNSTNNPPEGKPYMAHERNVLYLASGQAAPWSALTEAQLPICFQELKPFRGKHGSSRFFLERFLKASWPTDRPLYDYVFSTAMVNDFRMLSFAGQDIHCSWDD
jgi:hypothetical protein